MTPIISRPYYKSFFLLGKEIDENFSFPVFKLS